MTLLQLIQRLQAIKDTGSMLPLCKFIEELKAIDKAIAEEAEPVAPVPAPPAIETVADTTRSPRLDAWIRGRVSEAELLALSGQSPIIHNIDPYSDTPAVETEPSIEAGGENDFTQQ